MPWQVDIHTLDVGAGEASLVLVSQTSDPHLIKSILIDGGLASYARIVHQAVTRLLPKGNYLSAIVVSHHDNDHSAGLRNLLYADNLSVLCEEVAAILVSNILFDTDDLSPLLVAARVTYGAARLLEGWDTPDMDAISEEDLSGLTEQAEARKLAWDKTMADPQHPPTTAFIKNRENVAAELSRYMVRYLAHEEVVHQRFQDDVKAKLFALLERSVSAESRFDTEGLYSRATIYDNGSKAAKDPYLKAVNGSLPDLARDVRLMGVDRRRETAALGREIVWAGARIPPPYGPNAPYAVIVAAPDYSGTGGHVWQGTGNEPEGAGSSQNSMSIGIFIQFNNFTFYTAGDLTEKAEEFLVTALRDHRLPIGAAGLPKPLPPGTSPVAAMKCSHHGSRTSTSDQFLGVAQPVAAIISCGDKYKHPDQPLVDRLHNRGSVRYFMLTNCRYPRAHIPASATSNDGPAPVSGTIPPQNDPTNKSRVAGDNDPDNFDPARHRGDITLTVAEAESVKANARHFTLSYWENYPVPPPQPPPPAAPVPGVPGLCVLQVAW